MSNAKSMFPRVYIDRQPKICLFCISGAVLMLCYMLMGLNGGGDEDTFRDILQANQNPAQPWPDACEYTDHELTSEYMEAGIPNIAHLIWFHREERDISMMQLLSILSVRVFINPVAIYFHTNCTPAGPNWNVVKRISQFRTVLRQPQRCFRGERIATGRCEELQTDIDRLLILQQYGGIYLDMDIMVIKNISRLGAYPCVIGLYQPRRFMNSVILAASSSLFLKLWINSFLDNFSMVWAENSGIVSRDLAIRFPHLVRVGWVGYYGPHERYGFHFGPYRAKMDQPTSGYVKNAFFIHISAKDLLYDEVAKNLSTVLENNSSYGAVAKCILYNNLDILLDLPSHLNEETWGENCELLHT